MIQSPKAAQVQRFLLSTAGAALAIASILGFTTYANYQRAKINEIRAENSKLQAFITSAESLFDSGQHFDSLVKAIAAKQDI